MIIEKPYLAAETVALLLALSACSSGPKRPVIYPNAHSQTLNKAQREGDINVCMGLARDAGVQENRDGEVGRKAVTGALIGGVAAGAWGLISGDAGNRALAGAAAGAAAGGIKAAVDSTELNPTFKQFVNRCLSERGYDVIGWE